MDIGAGVSYAVTFPEVLTNGRAVRQATVAVTVPDARVVIGRYFSEMVSGWQYEASVRRPENWLLPNVLTIENWNAANLINADGWQWEQVESILFNRPLEKLAAIPFEADLERDWLGVGDPVQRLLCWMTELPGVGLANATKLLYQKRLGLIPILDRYVLQALGVKYAYRKPSGNIVGPALDAFRQVMTRNQASVTAVVNWLATNCWATHGLALSRVRVVEVVAWSLVRHQLWLGDNQPPWGSLYGLLAGTMPDDLDLDASLTEIRSEWVRELSEISQ